MHKVRWTRDAVDGVDNTAIFQRHGLGDAPAIGKPRYFAFQVDAIQRSFQNILRRHQQASAVQSPCKRRHRTVPLFGQRGNLAALHIHKLDDQPVGFVGRTRHRRPCHPFAIGRHGWCRIHSGIAGGQVDRLLRLERCAVNVEIGRLRLIFVGQSKGEGNAAAVGVPADLVAAAKGFRWGITDKGTVHRCGRCAKLAICTQHDREHAAVIARRFPLVPMADHKLVIFTTGAGAGL